MREITDHQVGRLNESIRLAALDGPGDGGASHLYSIAGPFGELEMHFQEGPLLVEGSEDGISIEVLMAICIDRMRGFQTGDFACRENALALTKLEESLMWLQKRARDRIARGVEGTHNK